MNTTPRPRTIVVSTENARQMRSVVAPEVAARALVVPEGFFVMECSFGSRTMARLTGRTVLRWGMACPTVERYTIDTVVSAEGAIWGVKGKKITGTFFVRPDSF